MPRSDYEGKEQIRDWISELEPKHNKILDIAVGEGTYLNLFKEQENLKFKPNLLCSSFFNLFEISL